MQASVKEREWTGFFLFILHSAVSYNTKGPCLLEMLHLVIGKKYLRKWRMKGFTCEPLA